MLKTKKGFKMECFIIKCSNGYQEEIFAKSAKGAKNIATRSLSHGCGDMSLYDEDDNFIAIRKFWSQPGNFGWDKWTK